MIVPIVQWPDKMLTTVCEPFKDGEDPKHIVTDLFDTVKQKFRDPVYGEITGLGLAAPQIGILRRAFVLRTESMRIAFVNPKIQKTWGNKNWGEEMCLSVPGKKVQVLRPYWVSINAQLYSRSGDPLKYQVIRLAGLEARVALHEIDHLDGITIMNRPENQVQEATESSTGGNVT